VIKTGLCLHLSLIVGGRVDAFVAQGKVGLKTLVKGSVEGEGLLPVLGGKRGTQRDQPVEDFRHDR